MGEVAVRLGMTAGPTPSRGRAASAVGPRRVAADSRSASLVAPRLPPPPYQDALRLTRPLIRSPALPIRTPALPIRTPALPIRTPARSTTRDQRHRHPPPAYAFALRRFRRPPITLCPDYSLTQQDFELNHWIQWVCPSNWERFGVEWLQGGRLQCDASPQTSGKHACLRGSFFVPTSTLSGLN